MAEKVKLEISTSQAVLAFLFVIIVVGVLYASLAGYIANPLAVGILLTIAVGLMLSGFYLQKTGYITKQALPLWFVFVIGIVLIIQGMVSKGYLPLVFSFGAGILEDFLTSTLLYTLLIVAIVAAVAAVYAYSRKKKAL